MEKSYLLELNKNDLDSAENEFIKGVDLGRLGAAASIQKTKGDLRLDRIKAVIVELGSLNILGTVYHRACMLNTYRSEVDYKPEGFDLLVQEIQGTFLYALIFELGASTEILREISYLFDYSDLVDHDLIFLRDEKCMK